MVNEGDLEDAPTVSSIAWLPFASTQQDRELFRSRIFRH
jgi:hypothetical protein